MIEQKTNEIIMQLKEIRKAKGYTLQRIFELVEETGGNVSLSTIKRVFADGSEEKNFRYEDSIKPIVVALVGKDVVEPEEGQTMSIAEQEANALRTVAALKEDLIQELREENQRLKEEYTTRISYIKAESEKKTEHIATLANQINRKDRAIFWLVFVIISLSVLIIVALIIDRMNPELGYFWRNVSAIISGNNPMKSTGVSADIGTVMTCILRR